MNNLELQEIRGMNIMNTFNKSELKTQELITSWLTGYEKCYQKVNDNTFEGEIILENSSIRVTKANQREKTYVVFRFTIQFEKPQLGKESYEFNENTNAFIIRKGVREFKPFFNDIEKKIVKKEKAEFSARLKEVGFENFIQEKASYWFKDNQWKELFIELANKSNKQIKEEFEQKWPNSWGSDTGDWVQKIFVRPDRDDESEGWYERIKNYENKVEKFKKLRSCYRYEWEEYQWELRKEKLEQALEQLKSEKAKEYEALAEKVVNNQLLFKEVEEKAEADIKKVFPEIDIEDKDYKVANEFVKSFVDLAQYQKTEAIANEKRSWTSEQWKNYWPNEPIIRFIEEKDKDNWNFDRELFEKANQRKDFVGECRHCEEAGKTTFKLVLKTKHSVVFICSRCENTEYHVNFERNNE